ncbi:hypothetical protein LIA77_09016 [Sarocladium implicatum]|nr:hypothetical protein LIA77_09016 [Sarocladium implicatum]
MLWLGTHSIAECSLYTQCNEMSSASARPRAVRAASAFRSNSGSTVSRTVSKWIKSGESSSSGAGGVSLVAPEQYTRIQCVFRVLWLHARNIGIWMLSNRIPRLRRRPGLSLVLNAKVSEMNPQPMMSYGRYLGSASG